MPRQNAVKAGRKRAVVFDPAGKDRNVRALMALKSEEIDANVRNAASQGTAEGRHIAYENAAIRDPADDLAAVALMILHKKVVAALTSIPV